jgi:glycerol-3-phosphate dehydrogenase
VFTPQRCYRVELGAAFKNVIALCAGCCDGMVYGDNTKAMLITRGLAEIARVLEMGGRRDTFGGLAGWETLSSPHIYALAKRRAAFL